MFDPRLPDGTIDAHAMQGATGDGCVRDKRPMTEAEERFIEAAIHAKRIGSLCGTALMLDEMDQLMKERTPKPVEPITPEERAVVEAAKRYMNSSYVPQCSNEFVALRAAVERLP